MSDAKGEDEIRALARRFVDAAEAGDVDALIGCYSPDAEIWHNTDLIVQTPAENGATLTEFVSRFPQREYAERRLEVFVGGFVHQHVLRVTQHDEVVLDLPAVLVGRVDDGHIMRLDEYFDRAHVARLLTR